jgi:sterol desaturase/sphingolipid hydroxylase (fatty acid hydroxylase superfamily)
MLEKFLPLPSPRQILVDPASIIVISIFFILMIAEAVAQGRNLPTIKFWKIKGITAFFIYFFLSSYLPFIWNDYLAEYKIFDLTFLGDCWGGLTALLLYEPGVYIWYRSMHKNNLLWRVFHQIHHSAERVDTYGAFFFTFSA